MHVARVSIQNCRAFEELELSLLDPDTGRPFSLVALTGENGSGKTTILDCIARVAERGNLPREWTRGPGPEASAEVQLAFTADELGTLHRDVETDPKLARSRGKVLPTPIESTLCLRSTPTAASDGGEGNNGAFSQQRYRRWFARTAPIASGWRVVVIPHDRSLPPARVAKISPVGRQPDGFVLREFGYKDVKQHLVDLEFVRLKRKEHGGRDPMEAYRRMVNRLFRGKSFVGVSEDLRVLFRTHDGQEVDFDELSSGERAVLALYSALIRPELSHSVFLVDEPEQHLHPTWQAALPAILAENARSFGNQFILATHSVEIAEGVQEEGGAVFTLTPSDAPVEGAPSDAPVEGAPA